MAYATGYPLYKKSGNRITTMDSSLQMEALYIYHFSKEFPNSGTLLKLLTVFSQRITRRNKDISELEANVLISILTEVALGSPKAFKILLHLISVLLEKLSTTEKREKTVQSIYDKFKIIPNIGELQVWMQHITYQMPNGIHYSEPLCKIVSGEQGISLWNNEWIRDDLKLGFPQYTICTDWLRDHFTPVIDIDEVSLFDVY